MKAVAQILAALVLFTATMQTRGQGTAFTYQGRLNENGAPANGTYDLRFILYSADVGGSQVGPILTNAPVSVVAGLFTVTLDFGINAFSGSPRWLEIGVRTNGNLSAHTPLNPRQPVTATPYAITAGNVALGNYSNAVSFNNAANMFSGNGAGLTALNASQLTSGAVPVAALSNAWKLGGNAGNTADTHFLGTTDNQPLELRVNNQRVLRLEPGNVTFLSGTNAISYSNAPNVIGGASLNHVGPGVVGAVIAGGGVGGTYLDNTFVASHSNKVSANFGSIVGGLENTILTNAVGSTVGGGLLNTVEAGSQSAIIAGGFGNRIETNSPDVTIGGGRGNRIGFGGLGSVIAGGQNNFTFPTATYGTIGGGYGNGVGGFLATVPGGENNQAQGSFSFAAGRRSRAYHNGAFVWADSTDADFTSTANNQFLIRASGGVGIGTTTPGAQLEIAGTGISHQRITDTATGNSLVLQAGGGSNMKVTGYNYTTSTGVPLYLSVDGAHTHLNVGGGNVGIGNVAPPFQLSLSTDSAGKPNGGSWANLSDARIKKNIQPLSGALDQLTQLRGVSFEWIHPTDHADQTGRQAGFIAQEVERVFPNWVQEVPVSKHDATLTPDGKVKSLSLPFEFDALMVEALRELRAENAELKKSVRELKERVSQLAAQRNGGTP